MLFFLHVPSSKYFGKIKHVKHGKQEAIGPHRSHEKTVQINKHVIIHVL